MPVPTKNDKKNLSGIGKKVIDMFIIEGAKLRKKTSDYTAAKKPLDQIVDERAVFNKARAYLYPVFNFIEEYTLFSMPFRSASSIHRHPEHPDSLLTHRVINYFYEAMSWLEYSIKKGQRYLQEKQDLLDLLTSFEEVYVTAEHPKEISTQEDVDEYGEITQRMISVAESISAGYSGEEEAYQKIYDDKTKELLKQGVFSVGTTAGVAVAGTILVTKLGVTKLGGKVASVAKKIVTG